MKKKKEQTGGLFIRKGKQQKKNIKKTALLSLHNTHSLFNDDGQIYVKSACWIIRVGSLSYVKFKLCIFKWGGRKNKKWINALPRR